MGKEEIFNYVMETPENTNPNVLRSLLDNNGSDLPPVTPSDNGKVLAVVDGAWAAKGLNSSVRAVQIEAEKVNGAYTATTQLTSAEVINGILNGYAFQLFVGSYISEMQPLVNDARTFVIYKATLQTQETVIVTINGLDEENAGITIEPYSNKFIVTLTPTAQDFSGTMDKTVAEINAAYEAGQEIWFKVLTRATSYVEVPVSFLGKDTSFDYPNFGAEIVQSATNTMIVATTGDTSDGTKQTYRTKIYPLTPAS